jgi:hypothetical protein
MERRFVAFGCVSFSVVSVLCCALAFVLRSFNSLKLYDERFDIEKSSWFLHDIVELVVRSRPLHIDVRFGGKHDRVRFMTSQIQVCVNEFWLRSQRKVIVIFEPGPMKPFKYGFERAHLQAAIIGKNNFFRFSFFIINKAIC